MSNNPVVFATERDFQELKRAVLSDRQKIANLRHYLAVRRHQSIWMPAIVPFHRGTTNEAISKGTSDKTVSRYLPGTTTDSGTDDTVTNELINIASGKVVHYFQQTKADGTTVNYITSVECPNT